MNPKRIYDSIKPEFIKNQQGKTTGVCIDLKTYEAIVNACNQWQKIQKEKGVRWVKVSWARPQKTQRKK